MFDGSTFGNVTSTAGYASRGVDCCTIASSVGKWAEATECRDMEKYGIMCSHRFWEERLLNVDDAAAHEYTAFSTLDVETKGLASRKLASLRFSRQKWGGWSALSATGLPACSQPLSVVQKTVTALDLPLAVRQEHHFWRKKGPKALNVWQGCTLVQFLAPR